jgi:sugar/nucleoside kinase (ribokinase family)
MPGIVVVGDLVTDVLVVHHDPLAVGSDTRAAITVRGGGQAANTAAWLAYGGCPVTLVAAVGDDPAGRERIAELAASGVNCSVRSHAGAGTGSVVVLASPGERTMFTDRGAALLLDPADVADAVAAAPDAAHLHLSGYPLLDAASRPGGLAALVAARARGLRTSVDAASAAPLRRVGAAAFLAWVRNVDLLICNADEAEELTRAAAAAPATGAEAAGGVDGAERAAAQARALTAVARHVVVKRGPAGALWCDAAGGTWSVPGPPAEVVDPTGAGDAFAAGLLAAWCAGAGPAEALAAGAVLGAAAVRQVGARPPSRRPSR